MPVVGAVVDAAIGWLVQSIMGNLFTEKLEAWTRRVGLASDVDKLKSAVRYVQMVVAAAEGRKIENEPLARSLADLRELLYDAEDVMDDLDYYRLKEQIETGNAGIGAATGAHNTANSSTWSVKQLSSTLSGILGKRKREDDMSEVSLMIKDIADKLRDCGRDVSDILKIDGLNSAGTSNQSQITAQDTRLTSSYLVECKVYGRDAEKESILKLMASNRSNGITVLPIIGIGGVGKTTLAQLVYNSLEVGNNFDVKIWVCVSDNFDVLRLTREMLGCVSEQTEVQTKNLDRSQKDLEEHMGSRRFLIVFDDVWDDMKEHSWSKLLAPLKRNQAKGNMILVTTRKLSVAEMTRTVQPVKLGALEDDDFWLLFKSCTFGNEKYEDHPSLFTIGKQIARELKGNPLAAKTVGALLKRNISIGNWTNILNNEEWKSLQNSGSIMPALKLSYDYLSSHLQQCFRFCCLFPKDYHFGEAELVRMWISQGFVHGNYTGKKLEDIGKAYLADLVNSGFFQHVERHWLYSNCFVMHDLMHDLAREVSRADFATIDGTECKEILPTTRHLSVVTHSAYSIDQHGNTISCESFKRKLLLVTSLKRLRSLVLIGNAGHTFFKCFQNMFKEAASLRLLHISATYADAGCFISYLNLCSSDVEQRPCMSSLEGTSAGNEFSSAEVAQKKWLPGLHVLKIHGCPRLMLLHPLPPAENTQVSVQPLLTYPALEKSSSDLSVMFSKELRVLNAKILAFENLTDVTSLRIEHCPNLVFLSFEGFRQLCNLRKMVIVSCGNLVSSCTVPRVSETWNATNYVAFPRLKHLKIKSCGVIAGKWLTEMLPHMQSLEELDIEDCPQMKSISIHDPRQEVQTGRLACQAVSPLLAQDEFRLHIPLNVLLTLEKLHIQRCPEMQLCGSKEGFGGFTSLTELIITGCPTLLSSADERFPLPPSVPDLRIEYLPKRLQPYFPESTSVRFLLVHESPDLQYLNLHFCTALQEIQIHNCRQLAVLEDMQYLSFLRVLSIEMNPELSAAWVRKCQDLVEGSSHARLLPPSLRKLSIRHLQDDLAPYFLARLPFICSLVVVDSPSLTFLQLGCLATLRNLWIEDCCSITSLQGSLPNLEVCFCDSQNLTSLQLGSLTTLKDLTVYSCDWLTPLETMPSLVNLTDMAMYDCRSVTPLLELLSRQPEGFSMFPQLERLYVDDLSALATPFCKHLTSLRYLRITGDSNVTRFTDEQEKALQLLTSLQGIALSGFLNLIDLPAVLHSLHSLKSLEVKGCPRISGP